ncbi:MAG: DUF2807 domain-containing protein [Bacteroidales bacterium]|nr:DUF2807 domain-containing protein [Bacteroidales bacterium]
MKNIIKTIVFATAILFAGTAYAQSGSSKVIVVGGKSSDSQSENLSTKSFRFNELTGIDAGSVFDITVTASNSGIVTVSAPAKTMEHIIVREKNGILNLRIEEGYSFGGNRWPSSSKRLKGPVKVTVGLSGLRYIDLSGAAKLSTKDNFSEKQCRIDISGASKVRLAKLSAEKLSIDASGASELVTAGGSNSIVIDASGAVKLFLSVSVSKLNADLSGASKVNIKGVADATVLDCSGASIFEGEGFITKTATVDLSGASKTLIGVNKAINGEVSGASNLIYIGDPDKVILERSRGASVSRK